MRKYQIRKIARRLLSASLAMPFILVLSNLFTGSSAALEIHNCSGTAIKLELYQPDLKTIVSTKAGIASGTRHHINPRSKQVGVKIYEDALVDTLKVAAPALHSEGSYSTIRMSSGRWQLVSGDAC